MKSKTVLFIALFVVAFLERVVFDLGANIEFVTTAIILSSYYLGRDKTLWLTILIMLATDLILGNTLIFIFTWTGFSIPAVLASNLFKKIRQNKVILGTSLGLLSNIFFFLWTNFGVWATDTWGMYPKTLAGLISCYINALPFLKNQLISSLLFIPIGFLIISLALKITKSLEVQKIPSWTS